jgi:predicted transposase YbfD/YdcC
LDKGHGRIELRQLSCVATDPQTLGLAGVAQVLRVTREADTLRKGQVIRHHHEVAFAITSLQPAQASPELLLQLVRDHWSIENGQHHRRDRTQDEDRCNIRDTTTARNLALFRSLAIFLCQTEPRRPTGKKSLPDFQRQVHRAPWPVIRRLTPGPHAT